MADPGEKADIAAAHPDVVTELTARVAELSAQRPPLGALVAVMDPALPCIYGRDANSSVPDWIKAHADAVRKTQPQSYQPGETPWSRAPKGGKITYTGVGR